MLFRCLRSGNIVNIEQPDDIERMKEYEYEVVKENDDGMQKDEVQEASEKEVKKRGRPKKG